MMMIMMIDDDDNEERDDDIKDDNKDNKKRQGFYTENDDIAYSDVTVHWDLLFFPSGVCMPASVGPSSFY